MVDGVRPLALQTPRTPTQSINAVTSSKTRDEHDRYPAIEKRSALKITRPGNATPDNDRLRIMTEAPRARATVDGGHDVVARETINRESAGRTASNRLRGIPAS